MEIDDAADEPHQPPATTMPISNALVPPRTLPPLLRLPLSIRHRIYSFCNLTVIDYKNLPVTLCLNGHDKSRFAKFHAALDSQAEVSKGPGPGPLRFHGLLLSCRTIHAEASAIVYSTNRFLVGYYDNPSLHPLRALRPAALSQLTYLKLVLKQDSCADLDILGCCDDHEHSYQYFILREYLVPIYNRRRQTKRLRAGKVLLTKGMVKEWKRTADYIAPHLRPEALQLSFVCDLAHKNADWARDIVAPLTGFPELKACHIRLSRDPLSALQNIAKDAVLSRTTHISVDPPWAASPHDALLESIMQVTRPQALDSRLLALPREIRFKILEYTDLVTPWKEVTWNREHPDYFYPYTTHLKVVGSREDRLHPCYDIERLQCVSGYEEGRGVEKLWPCPPERHHGCQFTNCAHRYPDPSPGCFCRVKHSAYSSTCQCWAPPTALFLVCHKLLADANAIFFSNNSFRIHDWEGYRAAAYPVKHWLENRLHKYTQRPSVRAPLTAYPFPELAASHFLTKVVPEESLGDLRSLILVFPAYVSDLWPGSGHSIMQEWATCIKWVRHKIKARTLTLRIIMEADSPKKTYLDLTDEQGAHILAAYDNFIAPLVPLGQEDGLREFTADFAWPFAYTSRERAKMEKLVGPLYVEEALEDQAIGEWRRLNQMMGVRVLGDRWSEDYKW